MSASAGAIPGAEPGPIPGAEPGPILYYILCSWEPDSVHETLTAAVTSEPAPRLFTPRFPSTAGRFARTVRARDSDGLKTDVFCEHRAPVKKRMAKTCVCSPVKIHVN
jgi:hypothetical protein